MFVLILQHTTKFPYLYLNIAPSLAICASFPLTRIIIYISSKRQLNWAHIVISCLSIYLLIILPLFHHKKNLKYGLIKAQSAIMDRVDNITNSEDAVFDGIGIAVTRKKATPYSITERWSDERKAGANYDIIESLKKSQPKVLIWNYRMNRLRDDEKVFLDTHFVPDWANVNVVGATVFHKGPTDTRKTINLLSSSEYGILAKDRHRVRVDGKIIGPVEYLTSGDHEIIVEGESQMVQLKYFPAVKILPPPPKKKFQLFPSYSD
jgi:hypothetical protein